MLRLSPGHGLVKQWSLWSLGPSNILCTSGIIPFQVLCPPPLALRWNVSQGHPLPPRSGVTVVPCEAALKDSQDQREERGSRKRCLPFLSLSFLSNFFILLYILVLTVPFISLPSWIFPFPTAWHEFSLLAFKVETKLTVQNARDYLGAPGTVENILFQNSAFSETLSPPPGVVNALKSRYQVHCQR